jgi:hypothetical protein
MREHVYEARDVLTARGRGGGRDGSRKDAGSGVTLPATDLKQSAAREGARIGPLAGVRVMMLLEQVDPEFGPYVGPAIVPKLTRTPGAVRWSATWDEGSHNDEVYRGLLGLSDDELTELRDEGVL